MTEIRTDTEAAAAAKSMLPRRQAFDELLGGGQ